MLVPGKVAGPSRCLRREKSDTIAGVSAAAPCICQWSKTPSRGGRSYRTSSNRERGGSELIKDIDACKRMRNAPLLFFHDHVLLPLLATARADTHKRASEP